MNEDDVATDTTLITAARRLFARHGYDGTSVRAITGAAGANLGAITYHFGSKRELYDRVVASLVEPLAERIERIVAGGGTVLDRSAAVVEAYFEYLAENPDLPPLMMQELVLAGAPPEVVAGPMTRVMGALAALIREGQERGEVRPGPAALMGIFVLSVPVHLGVMRPALKARMGVDLLDEEMRSKVTQAAVTWVRAALSGREASS